MKNNTKKTMWVLFCIFLCSSLFISCTPPADQAEKPDQTPKWERYEDKVIGFSVEYDAEKLTRDMGATGPFVFRREAVAGMPSLGITAGPYPPETTLEATAVLISDSLPRIIPDCIVHRMNNEQLIRLEDGNQAYYFELDWAIGGTELIAAFVAARKYDRLIVSGATDNKDGSMENLTAMVNSLRLDVEVDEAALRAKGFARDGKFVRTDSPAFTLEYPREFQNRPLQANQIFRAGIPRGSPAMSIAISALRAADDANKQLKVLAEGYANSLKSTGTDIKIISQNPIQEYAGFDAYQIQIVWRFRGQTTLTTVVHLIAKENQAILLAGHTIYGTDELTDIFKTIDLNP